MQMRHGLLLTRQLTPPFILLAFLLVILLVAGGASRADAIGQTVVRTTAWALLSVAILTGLKPHFRNYRSVLYLMLAIICLPALQLVPLPPSIWQVLPGRSLFVETVATAQPQPWRPLAIVPDATLNALSSLIVPLVVLVLIAGLDERQCTWLPSLLLMLIGASALIGLVQFSGSVFDNPLINDSPWYVGGSFANRNHFALLLAMGCLIAPTWAFLNGGSASWRAPFALGMVMLFALTILATGSRTGMVLGALAIVLSILLIRHEIKRFLARAPRWTFPALVMGTVGIIAISVLMSVVAGRAISIERVFQMDAAQDMRIRALPTVMEMVATYFPAGSGFGGFDPLFRVAEPFRLLKPTYFNHAHNDFIEVVLDGGLAGSMILATALGWWVFRSIRAWSTTEGTGTARLGSAMLLLVLIASIFDYPARTPMMMAMIVIAAVWLSSSGSPRAARAPHR